MNGQTLLSRQSTLKAAAAGLLLVLGPGTRQVLAETPVQIEGPFYPLAIGNDLAQVKPGGTLANGRIIHVTGRVHDEWGDPIPEAFVEIWQADSAGKYKHPFDPRTETPDPDFGYWGRATTDPGGLYAFRTIVPGAYPAGDDWIRPPHIHFRVSHPDFRQLITQMYFSDQTQLNDVDLLLRELGERARELVVSFVLIDTESAPGVKDLKGRFDIELMRVDPRPKQKPGRLAMPGWLKRVGSVSPARFARGWLQKRSPAWWQGASAANLLVRRFAGTGPRRVR
jgi:protocatechuate 3,4-dioxygenase beta subunit